MNSRRPPGSSRPSSNRCRPCWMMVDRPPARVATTGVPQAMDSKAAKSEAFVEGWHHADIGGVVVKGQVLLVYPADKVEHLVNI